MSIEAKQIGKRFGSFTALDRVSVKIETGELVALLGPSGSGKTTLLRIIAGLEGADSGALDFFGQDATRLAIRDRQVGFVFQHYALFRHMTIFNNVAFGLQVRPRSTRPDKSTVRDKVRELLRLVQLDGLEDRLPAQISGGQRQRVALARALAIEPRVLLLDEPFGALDAKVRKELRRWIRKLHDDLGITTVFVTHDQEEALEIADRVVVMNKARIEQIGTPQEVYDHPASAFVCGFLGDVNVLPVSGAEPAFVRPHDIDVQRHPGGPDTREGVIESVHAVGAAIRLAVRLRGGEPLEIALPAVTQEAASYQSGETVFLTFRRTQTFPGTTRAKAPALAALAGSA